MHFELAMSHKKKPLNPPWISPLSPPRKANFTPARRATSQPRKKSAGSMPNVDKNSMLIIEANEIAQYLQKDYEFSLVEEDVNREGDVLKKIKVHQKTLAISCIWPLDKLKERLNKMRKLMYASEAEGQGRSTDSVFFDPKDIWIKDEDTALLNNSAEGSQDDYAYICDSRLDCDVDTEEVLLNIPDADGGEHQLQELSPNKYQRTESHVQHMPSNGKSKAKTDVSISQDKNSDINQNKYCENLEEELKNAIQYQNDCATDKEHMQKFENYPSDASSTSSNKENSATPKRVVTPKSRVLTPINTPVNVQNNYHHPNFSNLIEPHEISLPLRIPDNITVGQNLINNLVSTSDDPKLSISPTKYEEYDNRVVRNHGYNINCGASQQKKDLRTSPSCEIALPSVSESVALDESNRLLTPSLSSSCALSSTSSSELPADSEFLSLSNCSKASVPQQSPNFQFPDGQPIMNDKQAVLPDIYFKSSEKETNSSPPKSNCDGDKQASPTKVVKKPNKTDSTFNSVPIKDKIQKQHSNISPKKEHTPIIKNRSPVKVSFTPAISAVKAMPKSPKRPKEESNCRIQMNGGELSSSNDALSKSVGQTSKSLIPKRGVLSPSSPSSLSKKLDNDTHSQANESKSLKLKNSTKSKASQHFIKQSDSKESSQEKRNIKFEPINLIPNLSKGFYPNQKSQARSAFRSPLRSKTSEENLVKTSQRDHNTACEVSLVKTENKICSDKIDSKADQIIDGNVISESSKTIETGFINSPVSIVNVSTSNISDDLYPSLRNISDSSKFSEKRNKCVNTDKTEWDTVKIHPGVCISTQTDSVKTMTSPIKFQSRSTSTTQIESQINSISTQTDSIDNQHVHCQKCEKQAKLEDKPGIAEKNIKVSDAKNTSTGAKNEKSVNPVGSRKTISILRMCRDMAKTLSYRCKGTVRNDSLVDRILYNSEVVKVAVINILDAYTQAQQEQTTIAVFCDCELMKLTCMQLVAAMELLVTHTSLWITSLAHMESSLVQQICTAIHTLVQQITKDVVLLLQACETDQDQLASESATRLIDLIYAVVKHCGELSLATDNIPLAVAENQNINLMELKSTKQYRDDDLLNMKPGIDIRQWFAYGCDVWTQKHIQRSIDNLSNSEREAKMLCEDCYASQCCEEVGKQVHKTVACVEKLLLNYQHVQEQLSGEMRKESHKTETYYQSYICRNQGILQHMVTLVDCVQLLCQAAEPLAEEEDFGAMKKVTRCSEMINKAIVRLSQASSTDNRQSGYTPTNSPTQATINELGLEVTNRHSKNLSSLVLKASQADEIEASAEAVAFSINELLCMIHKRLPHNDSNAARRSSSGTKVKRLLPATPGSNTLGASGSTPVLRCKSARYPDTRMGKVSRSLSYYDVTVSDQSFN